MPSLPLAMALPLLLTAGAAPPADVPASATTRAEFPRPKRVVAGEHVWRCEAKACRGRAAANPAAHAKICRRLARQVGPVLTFEAGGREFGKAELAACSR